MHSIPNQEQDSTEEILSALHQIQDTPGLQAEAATHPEAVLDRLGLSDVARHAVAFAITVALAAPAARNFVTPDSFWH